MALRDQPYLPLYIQDFLTDEKLAECSAEATGVYIRIMCLMHKQKEYGKILLKQKYKQNSSNIQKFACQLLKHLPYTYEVIESGLGELVTEEVLHIEDDFLVQRRMVKDGRISDSRASSGIKGGKKTQESIRKSTTNFGKANIEANSEYEIENENTDEFVFQDKGVKGEKETLTKLESDLTIEFISITAKRDLSEAEVQDYWNAFKIHSEGKFYANHSETVQHFRNWLKKQDKPKNSLINDKTAYQKHMEVNKAVKELIRQEAGI